MFSSIHPGEFLKNIYIEPFGLSLTTLATDLDISKSSLSRLIKKKASLSVDMARRLEKFFGYPAKSWLMLQVNYDLSHPVSGLNLDNIKSFKP